MKKVTKMYLLFFAIVTVSKTYKGRFAELLQNADAICGYHVFGQLEKILSKQRVAFASVYFFNKQ